ncbi:MAG: ABC transporter ATP-binding protein [Lachnospiraceae bacterium]|nr:ABC transporter ATP-binding protein [Lachnospiraceae bacterium]
MITISNINKSFGEIHAVDNITLTIEEKQVFGLIGTNGAGKSTLLRMMAGVLIPDSGEVLIDGEKVYDAPSVKEKIFFIPDEAYFFPNATALDMKKYYAGLYRGFDQQRFDKLLSNFNLSPNIKIASYSKGMKKQLSIILGIAANTKYLYCDETFDGLDPVMRQAAKSLMANDMENRDFTPIITSHNLRELEDICDHVGLLHKGGVLLSRDIEDMKLNLQKIQCVFREGVDLKGVEDKLDILIHDVRGSLHTYTVRGSREAVEAIFRGIDTIFFETLSLTLEEIFISETEVVGYDIRKLIIG